MSKLNCSYLFADYINYQTFLYFTAILLLVSLFYFFMIFYKNRSRIGLFGASITFFGGLFNMIERIFNNGCVLDYIDFFGLFSFNAFDVMIDLGILLIILSLFMYKEPYEDTGNI